MSGNLLFYQQRFKPPNYKSTPGKNTAHIKYIGTRPGVMKNSLADESGLFGKVNQLTFQRNLSLSQVIQKVNQVSKEEKNVFRSIISFTSEQAAKLKLSSLSDWQEYAKCQIPIIAKEMGIKMENMEWAAAVHNKAGHPHIHIAFWDLNQQVQIQRIEPEKIFGIRNKLLGNTYPELKAEKIAAQENAEKNLMSNFKSKSLDYTDYFHGIAISKFHIKEILVKKPELYDEFTSLRNDLKAHKGSLKFKLLPPELKYETVHFIRNLIKSDEKLKLAVENYINARVDYRSIYTSNTESLRQSAADALTNAEKMLANSLLRSIRDMNNSISSSELDASYVNQSEESDSDCVNSIFAMFADLSRATRSAAAPQSSVNGSDLSKQAILEKIKENKDKGVGIER